MSIFHITLEDLLYDPNYYSIPMILKWINEQPQKITLNKLINLRKQLSESRPGPYQIILKDGKVKLKLNSSPEAMLWAMENEYQ